MGLLRFVSELCGIITTTKMESETGPKARFGVARTKKRVPEWVMPATKVAVFAADILLSAFCFLAAFMFRSEKSVVSDDGWGWSQDFSPYAGILAFAVVARALMLLYQRVYDLGGAFTYTREAIKVFKAILVSSLLIVAWAFLFRGGFAFREFSYSRGVFLIDFGIALAAFTLFHLSIRTPGAFSRTRHQSDPDRGRRQQFRSNADDHRTHRAQTLGLSRYRDDR